MADWVNNGSYRDLSSVLPGDPISAIAPTSQQGGNQVWDQSHAMTAPGGESGDLGDGPNHPIVTGPPRIDAAKQIPPGTDGKPKATAGSIPAGGARWSKTTVPVVNRES